MSHTLIYTKLYNIQTIVNVVFHIWNTGSGYSIIENIVLIGIQNVYACDV